MSKLGKISYLIAGIILLVALVLRLILGGWYDFFYVIDGLAGVSVIVAWVADYKFYRDFFAMKTTKHGMNMGVIIVLALVLMIAVNFLGLQFDKSFDLTKEKLNSLSDQSLVALAGLKDDLNILIFYRGSDDKDTRMQLKGNFQTYLDASPHVKIRMVDALLDQETAKKYLEHQHFAVIIDYGGHKVQVQEPYDEEKTTSAILKATSKEQKTISFLVGHGERDIDSTEEENIKELAESLRTDGYSVAKINLTQGDKLPDPPGVVALVGPHSPYLDAELEALRAFARAGGHLLIAADPGEHHNLALLTKSLGIEFHNNYVLNQFEQLNGLGPLAALGGEYDRTSDITKKFYDGNRVMGSIFMIASEVTKAPDAPAELTFKELVKSSPQAYVNSQPKPSANPEKRAITLGLSVRGNLDKDPKAKDDELKKNFTAVVYGDSDFMTNKFLRFGANRDLALNSLLFLADDSGHISIRPKAPEATPLEMTQTKEVIFMVSGLGLPLVLIILSGFFWYRRRNL